MRQQDAAVLLSQRWQVHTVLRMWPRSGQTSCLGSRSGLHWPQESVLLHSCTSVWPTLPAPRRTAGVSKGSGSLPSCLECTKWIYLYGRLNEAGHFFSPTFSKVRRCHGFVDVRDDMRPVLQVDGHLNHVETHVHHMLPRGAVVA